MEAIVPITHYTQFDTYFNNLLVEKVEAEEIPNDKEILPKFKGIFKTFENIDFGLDLGLGTIEINITDQLNY